MSRRCELTGVGVFTGNKVSHSNIKTRTRWLPNLKKKLFEIPELGQSMTLMLTARAMRTIDKHGGLSKTLFEVREEKMSPRLMKAKAQILKQRQKASLPKGTAKKKA